MLKQSLSMPATAESLLSQLTPEQIHLIEDTISRIKRQKLDNEEKKVTTEQESTAQAIATALASAMTSAVQPKTEVAIAPTTRQDPVAEVRDGVEWVSFVYSHNRTLRRYNIRTDIHTVDLASIDQKFKEDNCVYPRANLPKETYRGNRWAYETECNVLGWKLAWLNKAEIAGKRGLIQRAVDSYRNRYPSMRSRRVARQEKLMKGTLRKRKNREDETSESAVKHHSTSSSPAPLSTLTAAIVKPANHPKTLVIEDGGVRLRIKINVEGMDLDEIPFEFRKSNCVFPRAMIIKQPQTTTRWLEESLCNELGWKLAWLNQRHLAGRKNLLQRALDTYRTRYMPSLQPRKNSRRAPPVPVPQAPLMQAAALKVPNNSIPLTVSALNAQNAWYAQQDQQQQKPVATCKESSAESCTSGTTASLDFGDCFSLADEPTSDPIDQDSMMITPPYSPNMTKPCCDTSTNNRFTPCSCGDESSTTISSSSACTPSPPAFSTFFNTLPDVDNFESFMLPPAGDMSLFADKSDSMPKPPTTTTTATTTDLKMYDAILSSPSLPSSAVQQDDLIVKMEDDDLLLPPSEFTMTSEAIPLFDLF